MPTLSIITTAFNSEKTIKRCAKSILNQSMPDFEWVIVNDGSTDKTSAILHELCLKDKRVSVITNAENFGLSASRRIGITACSSELVTFLDADDFLSADALEQYLRAVRLDYADIYICDSKLRLPPGININFNIAAKAGAFRCHNTISGANACMLMFANKGVLPNVWDKLYRRSLLIKHAGPPMRHTVGEDLILNTRVLLNAGQVTAIHKSCYVWNYNGMGRKYYLDKWPEYTCTVDTILAELPSLCNSSGLDLRQARAMLALNYCYCMRESYLQRKLHGGPKTGGVNPPIDFVAAALNHPVMSFLDSETFSHAGVFNSVNATAAFFDKHLHTHKKYYTFTRLLDFFNRHKTPH